MSKVETIKADGGYTLRRETPQEEFDRLAERVYNSSDVSIIDKGTYDYAFNKYMDKTLTNKQDTTLREETFKALRNKRPSIVDGDVFTQSGGKDFEKDKSKKAKVIVNDVETYQKKGASKVDLKGYDMPTKRKGYYYLGTVKQKDTYARKDTIIINNKVREVYRDRKGRFTKVNK